MVAVTYYIRWAFGPENFGTNAAIMGACILIGIVVGTFLAPKLFKKTIPVIGVIISTLSQVVPLGIIFLLSLFIDIPLVLFFLLLFSMMVFSGVSFIPASLMHMEIMDYNRWKQGEGKGMEALVQSVGGFVMKLQTAVAGLATGAVLIAVGYDAALFESEEFIEAGGTIPPELLDGLLIVFCVIPVFLAIAAAIILKFYPLKKDERALMYSQLDARKEQ
jgi:Na+/melibiose symporter-like transporter